MVKKFDFKGMALEDLQKVPNEKLFELLNSRQRRSLKRGLSDNKKKIIAEIKLLKEGTSKNVIKTHQRDIIILLIVNHLGHSKF